MLPSKMNELHSSRFASALSQRLMRGMSLAAAALLLGGALVTATRAQDTDSTTRTGEKPDTTVKKDSAPPGGKKDTKKAAKKTTDNSKTAKNGKKGHDKNAMVAKRLVLVFPVDAKGAAAEQISDIITDVEKARLSATGQFGGVSFLTSLPSIRRAVGEQSLTPADVTPPYAMLSKAQKLTTTAGYDAAVISSLDQYEYNADNQNVTMVLTIQMIDYSSGTPRSYTAANTVTTAPKSAKNATDVAASSDAARNLAEKLMTDVLKSAQTPKAMPSGGTGTTGTTTPAAK